MLAVRWYSRYGRSYRDGELLAERANVVDHVTVYRWAARRTPPLVQAAGRWAYMYRVIDQSGQVIDVQSRSAAAWPTTMVDVSSGASSITRQSDISAFRDTARGRCQPAVQPPSTTREAPVM